MPLMHIIYVSTARDELAADELAAIMTSSVRNNAAVAVSGMLLYAGGNFMQVLEGPEKAVEETYARISRDPRHHGVFVLERGPIAARSFESWGMGFRRLGREELASHRGFAPFFERGFDPRVIGAKPGLAMEILQTFAATQRG